MAEYEEAYEAISVSHKYVRDKFPSSIHVVEKWATVIIDRGSYWEVLFLSPEPISGGGPVLHLEKSTLKVIKAYREQ